MRGPLRTLARRLERLEGRSPRPPPPRDVVAEAVAEVVLEARARDGERSRRAWDEAGRGRRIEESKAARLDALMVGPRRPGWDEALWAILVEDEGDAQVEHWWRLVHGSPLDAPSIRAWIEGAE